MNEQVFSFRDRAGYGLCRENVSAIVTHRVAILQLKNRTDVYRFPIVEHLFVTLQHHFIVPPPLRSIENCCFSVFAKSRTLFFFLLVFSYNYDSLTIILKEKKNTKYKYKIR